MHEDRLTRTSIHYIVYTDTVDIFQEIITGNVHIIYSILGDSHAVRWIVKNPISVYFGVVPPEVTAKI